MDTNKAPKAPRRRGASTQIVATPALAYAVSRDAGNMLMRKRCLQAWDEECAAACHAAFERVCKAGGFWVDHENLGDPANVVALQRWNDLLSAGLTIDSVPEHLRHTFS